MTTFNRYADPGHSWVKVPKALLESLGIESKITLYSYARGEYVYLEEDCDLFTFHVAMQAAGKPFKLKEHHTNRESRIRGYEHYWSKDN